MPVNQYGPLPDQPGYNPRLPTSAQPGSEAKVRILEDRARLKCSLFIAGDEQGREISALGRALLPAEEPNAPVLRPLNESLSAFKGGSIERRGERLIARAWRGLSKGGWEYLGSFDTEREAEQAIEAA